jgi:hypothetical protein
MRKGVVKHHWREVENNARGLTNKKRKELSELYKQLRIFLGSESEW